MGRDLLRPHAHWHRLRHELRPHARAALGHRLPSRAARNGADVSRPVLNVPTAQVALNVARQRAQRPLVSAGTQTTDALRRNGMCLPMAHLIITAVTVTGKTGLAWRATLMSERSPPRSARRGDDGTVGQSVKAGSGLSARRRSRSAGLRSPAARPWTRGRLPPPRSARFHAPP